MGFIVCVCLGSTKQRKLELAEDQSTPTVGGETDCILHFKLVLQGNCYSLASESIADFLVDEEITHSSL